MTTLVDLDRPALPVPRTAAAALDPAWLTAALAPVTGGATIASVAVVETIRTVATKIRFVATFAEAARAPQAYCLKALLDVDAASAQGGPVTVLEADFYGKIAAHVAVRVPDLAATVIDRAAQFAVVIMRDVIAQGGHFCSALDAFTAEETRGSIDQLAQLHRGAPLLADAPWIRRRVSALANSSYVTAESLQGLLDGERGAGLPPRTRDAATLIRAMKALATIDEAGPDVLIHGDAHAGNIFRTGDGPGLIDWQLLQRGGWALDLAYHINAVLPVAVAEASERELLHHYLATARGLGIVVPDAETAWRDYRQAAVYGYYLWSITRRVDPAIINVFVNRLGAAVTRHASFDLLSV